MLARIPWLSHGFGTRLAPLSQEGMASLKQIHSAASFVVDRPGLAGEGDALITRQPGVVVSVRTADCYPILLADPVARAVAAIHAGWRGADARIVQKVVERMSAEFGTRPENITAAIGPGIGGCCYQVGDEVARKFGMSGAGKLDLARENANQLEGAGVLGRWISVMNSCTYCRPQQFHSYRRDGEQAGRMISFIEITG